MTVSLLYFLALKGLLPSKTVCAMLPTLFGGAGSLLAAASVFYSTGMFIRKAGAVFLACAIILHGYFLFFKAGASFCGAAVLAAWIAVLFGAFFAFVFKKDGLLFFAQLFSAALCLLCVSRIGDAQLDILVQGAKVLGVFLLLVAGMAGQIALIFEKKIKLLQHCLYGGTFFLGAAALFGALAGHEVQAWALGYYLALIHLSLHRFCDEFKLALGACAGWIPLFWGWPLSAILAGEVLLICIWKWKLLRFDKGLHGVHKPS